MKGLYLLARPSTPAEVIEAVAERSEEGDTLMLAKVRDMIAERFTKPAHAKKLSTRGLLPPYEPRFTARESGRDRN